MCLLLVFSQVSVIARISGVVERVLRKAIMLSMFFGKDLEFICTIFNLFELWLDNLLYASRSK